MLLMKLIRYVRGYIQFSVTGGFVERFLNILSHRGITVWNGRKENEIYTGHTVANNYKKMRPVAKTTGVKMRVVKKKGLPFLVRRYRKRIGLFLGVVLFGAFMYVVSNFIWLVEVRGNEKVPTDIIVGVMEDLGVKPGCLKNSLDQWKIERQALIQLDELSWVAINIKGSTAYIDVKERVMPVKKIDVKDPCNVIASESGLIKYLEVYDGVKLVKIGDAVQKGDVLVTGIVTDKKEHNTLIHARAKIIAEVNRTLDVQVPFEQTKLEPTGKSATRHMLGIFGIEVPLFWPSEISGPYEMTTERIQLKILGLELPITIVNQQYILQREIRFRLSEEDARKQAIQQLAQLEMETFQDSKILQKDASGFCDETGFQIKSKYICQQDIAIQQEILTRN